MANDEGPWLQVISKSLAYLCMQQVVQNEPKRLPDLVSKVQFMEGLGLSMDDAARLMGTTANSVKTNLRERERNSGKKAKK